VVREAGEPADALRARSVFTSLPLLELMRDR
jgi:hypothetical protein